MARTLLRLTDRITGARVSLGAPRAGDARAMHALREQSRPQLAPWEPARMRDETLAQARARLQAAREDWKRDAAYRFTVYRNDDGALLGHVGLSQLFRRSFCNALLGYWVGTPYARQGYMTEALRLVLATAFGPLALHRVQAAIVPGNAPSVALAERVGMRREGLALRYLEIAGRWQDHYLYAITAEEWPSR